MSEFNEYAEQCVLGAAVLEPEKAGEIVNGLDAQMLSPGFHRELFTAISDLFWAAEQFDVVSLVNRFPDRKEYLVELAQLASVNIHTEDYIRVIRENWQQQELDTSLLTLQTAGGTMEERLQGLENLLQEHRKLLEAGQVKGPSGFTEAFAQFQEWAKLRDDPGLKTGFGRLDNVTGGLLPGTVFTVAARPGGGKTDFALNLAMREARAGTRVLYFSMEMTTLQLMQRVAANLLRINSIRIRDRSLTAEEQHSLELLTDEIRQMNTLSFFDEPKISAGRVWHYVELYKPKVVVIDHIGLMKRPEMRDQYKALGMVSNDLKQIALKSKISIVQLAQMNRQVEARKDGKPSLSDLRESGDLEQDSDFVGFLSPRLGENQELCGSECADVDLYLLKNRHGRTGKLGFKWQPQYHSYTEVEHRFR